MQRILLELKRSGRIWWNMKLLVSVLEIGLRVVEAIHHLHATTDSAIRAISTEHHISFYNHRLIIRQSKGCCPGLEIDVGAARFKRDLYSMTFRDGEQRLIQLATRHTVDELTLTSVGLIRLVALHIMHHASVHGD